MPDVVGFRAKMGVMIPLTITVVKSDFWDMRIPGVTCNTAPLWHAYRTNGWTDKVYGFGSLLSEH